jgi:phage gp36-like protein
MFLIKKDYQIQIQLDHLNQIMDSDDSVLHEGELAAIEEMQSYLRSRYKVEEIFFPVLEYSSGNTYTSGSTVHSSDLLYTSLVDNNNLPLSDQTAWEAGDRRNQLLVLYLVDIVLYHLHSRLSPRNVPENRFLRYETAINWLKAISKGSLLIDLPKLEAPTSSFMTVTSAPRRSTAW